MCNEMYGLEEYGGSFESVGGEVKKFYKFEGEGFKGGREGSMVKRKTDLFEGGGVFRFAFWLVILKFSLLVSFRFVVCAAVSLVWLVMLVCFLIIMLSVGKVYFVCWFFIYIVRG